VAAEHAVAFPKLGPVTVKPFQSRQKAQLDLIKAEREQLAKLTDIFGIPESQLKFIIEAWSQVCHHSFIYAVDKFSHLT